MGTETEYQNLMDVISFDGFSFGDYYNGERNILQPRLEELGYTEVSWFMGERDSFGPLSRICHATNMQGETKKFMYG